MRTFTFLLLSFISLSIFSQELTFDDILRDFSKNENKFQFRNNDIYVVDSIYCFSYNGDLMSNIPSTREYNLEFTQTGEAVQRLRQRWDENEMEWNNELLVSIEFDDDGNIVKIVEESWDTAWIEWRNVKRTQQEPNDDGQFTQVLEQLWDTASMDWINDNLVLFAYNGNGENTEFNRQIWDVQNSTWIDDFKITNIWSNGKLAADLFTKWFPDSMMWIDGNRSFHSYNNEGLKSEISTEIYDPWQDVWENSSRQTYAYDIENQQVSLEVEVWDNVDSIWLNKDRFLNTYDLEGNNDSTFTQFWQDSIWVNFFLTTRQFDSVGHQTHFEVFIWQNAQWELLTICDFFWRLLNPVSVTEIEKEAFCRMSNPIQLGTEILCELPNPKNQYRMVFFDTFGRVQYAQVLSGNSLIFNLRLPKGFYLGVILDGNEVVWRKKLILGD